MEDAPRLIAFTGQKGHGKDTAAKALGRHERINFADALKKVCAFVLNVDPRYFEDPALKETIHEPSGKTYREWMQGVGMAFRDVWEPVWVEKWKSSVAWHDLSVGTGSPVPRLVVCTDVRFPNEVSAVKDMGGTISAIFDPRKGRAVEGHCSETGVYDLPFDNLIVNSGDIDDLHSAVRRQYGEKN